MRQLEQCAWCSTVIDTELDDVDDFEPIELGSGRIGVVCAGCVTGAEARALDEVARPDS